MARIKYYDTETGTWRHADKQFLVPNSNGIAISGASIGQTVRIAEVDNNGVPTAWEAVDIPGEEGYELIETIVCDGAIGSISKTNLNLKSAKIYINMKADTVANSVCIEAYNQSGLFGYAWLGNCINTAERWANAYIVSDGKNAYIEFTSPATLNYNTGNMIKTSGRMNADTPINRISIYVSGSGIVFPSESTIEIWGIYA